jgi:hypothetical protein
MSRRAVIRWLAAAASVTLCGGVAAQGEPAQDSAQEAPTRTPAAPGGSGAGEARSAVLGDTIRVGDVVPVAVRVVTDRGQRVMFPDTLPLEDDGVENAARVRVRVDTLADGRLEATATYAVTPWRVGELSLPAVEVPVVSGRERVRTVTASLPGLEVTSVLPADTAGVEPRPAKGVIGRSWAWWPILLVLAAMAALVAAVVLWRRRRRGEAEAPAAALVPPRERALARLQEARAAGLVEAGRWKDFYTRVSEALREYVAALDPEWSEDLTSTELAGRVRRAAGMGEAADLGALLRAADQVKFARRTPDRDTALAEWEGARRWVQDFTWPPPAPEQTPEVAA